MADRLTRRGLGSVAAGSIGGLSLAGWPRVTAATLPGELDEPDEAVSLSPILAPPPARPIEVAAYYFPNYHPDPRSDVWYGEGWTEWELVKTAQPRFPGHRQPLEPAWGYFDESDPAWASNEITLAADHGITTFLYDWYWYEDAPYLQGALENGFLHAPDNHHLKFALMWANHDWQHIQPARAGSPPPTLALGAVAGAGFERLTDYVAEHYLSRPNYLTLDGLPYFSIYDLATFVKGLGGLTEARQALDRFQAKALTLGFPGLHVNGIVWIRNAARLADTTQLPELVELAASLGLASVASYTWFHHDDGSGTHFPHGDYRTLARAYARWKERCRRFPLDYHPNATMGWDPSPRTAPEDGYEPRGYPWTPVMEGNTPEAFRQGLERARAYVERPQPSGAQQRLVTINAWNEWTEGSYLLPEATHGTAYLEAVRSVFGN
jgi:hypothetical protein